MKSKEEINKHKEVLRETVRTIMKEMGTKLLLSQHEDDLIKYNADTGTLNIKFKVFMDVIEYICTLENELHYHNYCEECWKIHVENKKSLTFCLD